MKYDLIVIGAGPGGLMAARTAAGDGMKVLLLERKRDITEVNRACVQIFYLNKLDANWLTLKLTPKMDAYIEQVSVETFADRCRFNFLDAGFSLDYEGPLRAYYNWLHLSPSGNYVTRYPSNNFPWGYFYSKKAFLAGLLDECLNLGVKLMAGTKCVDIENQPGGVTCTLTPVMGDGASQTIKARRGVLADGSFSPIMEKLGFNEGRAGPPPLKFLSTALDRIDTPYPDSQYLYVALPSQHHGYFLISSWPHGRYHIQVETMINSPANLVAITERFMNDSPFTSWFKHSKILKRMTCNMALVTNVWDPARESLICVGDNAAYAETAIKGAIAAGYQAAQATRMTLAGQDGNDYYNKWWDIAFPSHSPQYRAATRRALSPASVLNDQEMDTLYRWIYDHDFHALLADVVGNNMKLIEAELPDIYAKIRLPVAPK